MSRGLKIAIGVLALLVVISLITLPSLERSVERATRMPRTEEQARREVMQTAISTPTDVQAQAQLFFLSASAPGSLEPATVNLPLSADPVQRSKQLINALIADAPAPERRTLPPDAELLAFYLLPDGTAIADFSDELSAGSPSGILSEQTVVNSIAQTLGANVSGVRQLKILLHGQDAETLAGHLDLSGFFPVPSAAAGTATPNASDAAAPAATASAPAKRATQAKRSSSPSSPSAASPH